MRTFSTRHWFGLNGVFSFVPSLSGWCPAASHSRKDTVEPCLWRRVFNELFSNWHDFENTVCKIFSTYIPEVKGFTSLLSTAILQITQVETIPFLTYKRHFSTIF